MSVTCASKQIKTVINNISAVAGSLTGLLTTIHSLTKNFVYRFEKLDITPKSAQKIKPVLERWMKEAEERYLQQKSFKMCCNIYYYRYKSGQNHLTDFIGIEPSKKRKRRTSFTPQALELLNAHFERNTHPSGKYLSMCCGIFI